MFDVQGRAGAAETRSSCILMHARLLLDRSNSGASGEHRLFHVTQPFSPVWSGGNELKCQKLVKMSKQFSFPALLSFNGSGLQSLHCLFDTTFTACKVDGWVRMNGLNYIRSNTLSKGTCMGNLIHSIGKTVQTIVL